jgi:hypothetical protein
VRLVIVRPGRKVFLPLSLARVVAVSGVLADDNDKEKGISYFINRQSFV